MADQTDVREDQPELPLLGALGLVLLYANELEEAITDLFWVVSRQDFFVFLDRARKQPLTTLAKDLAATYRQRVSDPSLLQCLDALEPRIMTAVAKRNEFVHATWAAGGQ